MILLNKLKYLKMAIRNWRVKTTQMVNKEIDAWKKRVAEIELMAKSRPLTAIELEERSGSGIKIDEHARMIAMNLKKEQK